MRIDADDESAFKMIRTCVPLFFSWSQGRGSSRGRAGVGAQARSSTTPGSLTSTGYPPVRSIP